MDISKISFQLIKETPNLVYVSDIHTYELSFLNKSGRKMFGVAEEEDIAGKKCYEIIENRTSPCVYCTKQPLDLDTPIKHTVHNAVLNKYFRYTTKAIFLNKRMRLNIGMDVTDTFAERTVNDHLLSCIETLYTNDSPERSITELLRILANFYEAPHSYIMMLSDCGRYLEQIYQWCAEGVTPYTSEDRTDIVVHRRLINTVIKMGKLYAPANSKRYFNPYVQARLAVNKTKIVVLVPLFNKDDEFIGIVAINDPIKEKESRGLLSSVCKFIADYVEKTTLISNLNVLSYSDALSGLKNRHSYAARLAHFEAHSPENLGVMYLDINGLKETNDQWGHTEGDAIIAGLGKILLAIFEGDAYRIGGDEFIVLRANISQKDFDAQVQLLREHIHATADLSVSVGHVWNDAYVSVAQQIESADSLMYSEKLVHYQNNSKNAKYRTILRNALAADIASGKFVVYLQPQLALQDRTLAGAEALLRKLTSSQSIDSPAYFIPLYERLEIVHYLDFFVFETVCKTLQQWRSLGYKTCNISVNMSRVTLQQPDVIEILTGLCAQYDIEHSSIVIEITETMQAQSTSYLSQVLSDIAAQGFPLSLDDFGSGYSSLLTLAESEFSEIKIDKAFIQSLTTSQRAAALVRYTVDLCRGLHIRETVAEGVETQEVYDILKEIQCSIGQGYLFDKALPIEHFAQKYIFSKKNMCIQPVIL